MKRFLCLSVLLIAAVSAKADIPIILVLGDSISAAHGIRLDQGWVALLQAKLKTEGYGYQVVNASVSGETTAGGLARLPRALAVHHPKIVILELGGNDGLRALPVEVMRDNLTKIVSLSTAAGAKVVLLGMRMPPNYGAEYAENFHSSFDTLARAQKLPYATFFLTGIAQVARLMQDDGIHPNALGQPKLLENAWAPLQSVLRIATSP